MSQILSQIRPSTVPLSLTTDSLHHCRRQKS